MNKYPCKYFITPIQDCLLSGLFFCNGASRNGLVSPSRPRWFDPGRSVSRAQQWCHHQFGPGTGRPQWAAPQPGFSQPLLRLLSEDWSPLHHPGQGKLVMRFKPATMFSFWWAEWLGPRVYLAVSCGCFYSCRGMTGTVCRGTAMRFRPWCSWCWSRPAGDPGGITVFSCGTTLRLPPSRASTVSVSTRLTSPQLAGQNKHLYLGFDVLLCIELTPHFCFYCFSS